MTKPKCKLIGEDGNVFYVVGKVKRVLVNAGQQKEAEDFVARAFACKSYDEVLQIVQEYVEVE